MYVAGNNWLYNATRLATLAVGGAAAVAGTVGAEQLTAFMFYTEFLASALLSVCDQVGGCVGGRAGHCLWCNQVGLWPESLPQPSAERAAGVS